MIKVVIMRSTGSGGRKSRPSRMGKPRRKIDATLKAKIALEALREQATVADS